jgi:hypothetical protein
MANLATPPKLPESYAHPVLATWRPLIRRPGAIFWVTTLGMLILILIRNSYVFTTHIYEDGDFALNSLLVNNTRDGLQLVGNGSRTGFSHPGPVYIYVLSAGQGLFHDVLHIVPSQYGGQFVGDAILQSVLLGLVVASIFRITRSLVGTGLAAAVIFAFAATHQMIGYVWFPCMYMSAFALLIAAAAAVAAGHTRELPLLVLASGLLVHGHVAFILFVGATIAIVAVAWVVRYRHRWRNELTTNRRSLLRSVALLTLFLLPLVLNVVLHYPGPWPEYLDYSSQQANSAHPLGESVRFLGHYWSTLGVPSAVFFAAGALGAAMLLLDRDAARRAYFATGYALLGLYTVLFAYYIVRGIDSLQPSNYYTGYFYEAVPMFVLVFAAAHAGILARERAASPRLVPAIAVGIAAVLAVSAAVSPDFTDRYRSRPGYPAMVAALQADPARDGRPVVVDFPRIDWPIVAGLIVQADRTGLNACLDDPYWTLFFTPASMCPTTAGHWRVTVQRTDTWDKSGTVVWSDPTIVVTEGSSQ